MKLLRASKKTVLYISIVLLIFLFAATIYYFHKTNIISNLEIKLSLNNANIVNQIKINAFGPLDRSFDIKYSETTKSWNTHELYLNRLVISIPTSLIKNDSLVIFINNKPISNYHLGINIQDDKNIRKITILNIYSKSFSDKFVFFTIFYFNRLIGLKIHFRKYLSLTIYLSMIIFVFIKVKVIQKKHQ